MSETIGFIGAGALGLPMATNLLNSGYELRVYNRTASKAAPLAALGARVVDQPADVVTGGGIVVSVVWDGAALESIVMSEEFLTRLAPGGLHVAMSTIAPETSKRLAAIHEEHGCAYVEAPVFGRPEAAVARQLWIPFAGSQRAKERARPLLQAIGAQGIFDFGEEIGTANMVKLVGNFLIGSAAHSLNEALSIARKSGVDAQAVVTMLTSTLFSAPIYQNYGKHIAEGGAPFAQSDIPLKDVSLLKGVAEQVDVPTPIASLLLDLLRK